MNNNEKALRERIREALQGGKLPNRRPDRIWGGDVVASADSAVNCMICGEPLRVGEIDFELEFNGREDNTDNCHVHSGCFAAWELELRIRETAPVTANPEPALLSGAPARTTGLSNSRSHFDGSRLGLLDAGDDVTIPGCERIAPRREWE